MLSQKIIEDIKAIVDACGGVERLLLLPANQNLNLLHPLWLHQLQDEER
jgi:hypothetical protein